jgi:signal transduction histidine kinase/DNA-binding response OmpR family regulator
MVIKAEQMAITTLTKNKAEVEQAIRILMIEDNPGDLIIVRELLKSSKTGFSLSNTPTLRDAIALLKNNIYDVILLDLGLPESSGIETLKEFLSIEVSPPVVVMTGLDDEEMAIAALREGAQDYLVKNRLTPENIIKSIRYSIERKKLENLEKKNSRQMAILSSTTSALYEGGEISQVYTLLCSSIRKLLGNAFIAALEKTGDDAYKLSNTEQFIPLVENLKQLGGNYEFSPDEISATLARMLGDGKIHHIPGGVPGLMKQADTADYRKLESEAGISHVYAIGILKDTFHYGGIIILSGSALEEGDKGFIENMCSQASLSIYRSVIQKNLIRSEARYQRLAGELEEMVKARTAELEQANIQLRKSEAQLMELNATKDKFFNIVAHDLKNPFTSLLGATELLFHNIQNMDTEKIRKLAQILNDSAKSGYAILLNLLDWSRSQTGTIRINLQKINLKTIVDDNIADTALSSLDKDILLESDLKEDILVIADRNMINTVLRNLLSNAIKFTNRGGKINVCYIKTDFEVQISVRDNGIGIGKENIDKLFRIDSKYTRPGTEKEGGTGLGLKLSREFVEKLGGKIWVISNENEGSEFFFTIPFISSELSSI